MGVLDAGFEPHCRQHTVCSVHRCPYESLCVIQCCLYMQIIEARNLTVPADVLHAFFTMDAYIVAGLNSEAGTTSRQTKV